MFGAGEYVEEVNGKGGLGSLDRKDEHAICDCINRMGDGVKRLKVVTHNEATQKKWTSVRH